MTLHLSQLLYLIRFSLMYIYVGLPPRLRPPKSGFILMKAGFLFRQASCAYAEASAHAYGQCPTKAKTVSERSERKAFSFRSHSGSPPSNLSMRKCDGNLLT